ncbi:MAG: DUF4249 domain-containing protein [Phaeodactylibacter sp.]|nr:DUF4249 domain-containing protein [Phaeodactylibacter sp.]
MQKWFAIALVLFSVSFVACNLENEIELELPAYQSKYVVECYLEPGQAFNLLLTRSDAYFNAFPTLDDQFLENILVDDAVVTIKYKDETHVLQNGLFFNPITFKLFNYSVTDLVPEDYETPFQLEIQTPDGNLITAETKLLPVVSIDSVVVQRAQNQDGARVLTYFNDDPNQTNFYRRMLHLNSLRDSVPEQDFAVTDRLAEESTFVFGTGYDYFPGDTIYNTLLHISPEYYDFLSSVQGAAGSNGNPFAQPGKIISNVKGEGDPIGIFTGIAVDRVETIIEE